MENISSRILQIILDKGISYGELSKRTGIPKSALQRYATGQTPKIPIDRIEAIAKALNVSSAWIMGWESDNFKNKKAPEKNYALSEGEEYLLELFRKIPDDKKQLAIEMLKAALQAK